MIKRNKTGSKRWTLGADKGYDTKGFVSDCRELGVTPHVARNANGSHRSAIEGRTTWSLGYAASQKCRRGIENAFGWLTTVADWERTRFRGLAKVSLAAFPSFAAFNILRISHLTAPAES